MDTVLIIDDATLMRNLIKRILVSNRYKVVGEAATGEEGLEKYKSLKPDLVFCDISMPGMGGIECLRRILAFDSSAKVVMCTSQGKEKFADEVLKIGARSYIIKPINANELADTAKRVLAGGGINYKDVMMQNATKAGLFSQKDVLDFLDAFYAISGKHLDALDVDHAYLQQVKAQVGIGAQAFLAAKLPLDEINKLVSVFNELCE